MVIPGVCARSRIAAVGRPPLQKNASILPSLSASTDCVDAEPLAADVAYRDRGRRRAALRNAITSVPLPGEPVETDAAAQIGEAC